MPGGFDTVLVVDFGAQYAQLIARRVRECHVYSEIVPSTMPVGQMLAKRPKAIILSGGPSSVYADGAPGGPGRAVQRQRARPRHLLRVPADGGRTGRHGPSGPVRPSTARPPWTPPGGRAALGHARASAGVDVTRGYLHRGPPGLRGDRAATPQATPVAAVEDATSRMFGVQFHPEVMHTEYGTRMLGRFLEAAGCRPTWTMLNIVEEQVDRDPRAGRRRARDLRAVRRRGFRRCRRAGPAGHRRAPDLRVRRSRPAAQGRGGAGGADSSPRPGSGSGWRTSRERCCPRSPG